MKQEELSNQDRDRIAESRRTHQAAIAHGKAVIDTAIENATYTKPKQEGQG